MQGAPGACSIAASLGLHTLISRSLAEVRLTQGVQNLEQFLVAEFIAELAPAATMEAHARGITFSVMPVEDGVAVEADRQVLAAVVGNLLQNAFKFTRPRTTVTLSVGASAERVLIEIQDECGGLPGGNVIDMFRPFEQRNADRTGLGLGLAFSRWGAEANHGRIYTRNLPERGCVFISTCRGFSSRRRDGLEPMIRSVAHHETTPHARSLGAYLLNRKRVRVLSAATR